MLPQNQEQSYIGRKASYDLISPHTGPASKYTSDSDAGCLALQVYFTLYSNLKASTFMMVSVYL